MKISLISLRIGGAFSTFFTVFHCLFGNLFNWDNTLNCLSQSDRAIMLTYHYICILIIGFMSVVSVFQAKQIMESKLGYSVLLLFSVFYLIRIVTEFTLFGFAGLSSVIIIFMCLIPLCAFTLPIFAKMKGV